MCLADFQDWLYCQLPPPPPRSLYEHVLQIYALQAQFHKHRRGKGVELNMMPPICLKSAKIYKKFIKNCHQLSMYTTSIEKKSYMCRPGIEFFYANGHMIQSVHMNSCLGTWKRFLLCKGPGSFKFFFQISRNVMYLKAYRLIPLIPHRSGHCTIPLNGVF
jgi:hypothetical protein